MRFTFFMEWFEWEHVTKLDPDKGIEREDVEAVCNSGTDAIMVGGTQRITEEKVEDLVGIIDDFDIPIALEPSNVEGVVYGVDFVLVPSVLNAGDVRWVVGEHKEWAKRIGKMPKDLEKKIALEGYIVLNPDSAVAKHTKAKKADKEDVVAYSIVAERFFNLPIVYIEYSGMFGGPDIVKAVSENLEKSTLFYGGGIDSYEKANKMAKYADTIIVGDAVYDEGIESLKDTVRGAKES